MLLPLLLFAFSDAGALAVSDGIKLSLDNFDYYLNRAFAEGAVSVGEGSYPPIFKYSDDTQMSGNGKLDPTVIRDTTRNVFRLVLAAIYREITSADMVGMVTVPLAKLTPLGANGSLTFKNGILYSRVPPT
jgi:hypothetical protein